MQENRQISPVIKEDENREEDFDQKWEPLLPGLIASLKAQVNALSTGKPMEETDEKALWEKYWSLEQDGIEEFTKAESEASQWKIKRCRKVSSTPLRKKTTAIMYAYLRRKFQ
uniref:Protein AATF n=1 Tax=Haemonchus contortus TaxID=6289 RepID=A0A7I4Z305_HAECO